MRYQRVCLEAVGYALPDEVVSSAELEQRLTPVYERLRLPAGRLELMTGICQRRFFPPGTKPGSVSIVSGRRALETAGVAPAEVGLLIHGSVCRDFLEPATACGVHHALALPPQCLAYDVSNACLGILTGMVQAANMIELGQTRAALVVGTECGRSLVENTIERLNSNAAIDRRQIKQFVASLTIGSGSVAVLLCDRELSRTGNRLLAATAVANTAEHALCQSDGLDEFMRTDSEQLMLAGVETAWRTFESVLSELTWTRDDVAKTICHQVGAAQKKLLFDRLGLNEAIDFSTFETLGNTGSAALPLSMALAAEAGHLAVGDRVLMMGIGSGINCQMMGVHLEQALPARGGGLTA
jgi:3-oxoacyl-[acyl-carrier-protein] synthase-3